MSQTVWTGAFLTGFIAYVATNLDNVAVLCAVVAGTSGAARKSAIALVASAGVLAVLALAGAELADELPLTFLRWLGLVPIALGIFALSRLIFGNPEEASGASAFSGHLSLVMILLSNSADTLAVFVPLLAESANGVRRAFLGGAGLAVFGIAVLLRLILSNADLQARLARLGPWFAPLAMILAGLYVILDTSTDLV